MTSDEGRPPSTVDALETLPRSGDQVEPPCGVWWQRLGLRLIFRVFGLAGGRFFDRGNGELRTMSITHKLFWIYKRHHTIRGRSMHGSVVGAEGWCLPGDYQTVGSLVLTGELGAFSPHGQSASLVASEGVRAALSGTVSLVNLEGAIGVLEKGTGEAPLLSTSEHDFATLSELFATGSQVVTLANNHLLDSPDDAIDATVRRLAAAGADVVGLVGQGEQIRDAAVVELGDLRMGVLATSFASNRDPSGRPVRPRLDQLHSDPVRAVSDLANRIEQLKRGGVDLVCLSLHWGHEFEWLPRPAQIRTAHQLAELGADIIHGHHPHVIQPVEVHTCSDGRRVPILYSLGNLVTTVLWPHLRLGFACSVDVGRDATGRAVVVAVDPTPTVLSRLDGAANRLILETLEESIRAPHGKTEERDRIRGYAEAALSGGGV